jgi:hypothetical protein
VATSPTPYLYPLGPHICAGLTVIVAPGTELRLKRLAASSTQEHSLLPEFEPYASPSAGAPVAKWNVLSIVSLVTSRLWLNLENLELRSSPY